jgi:protein TonB
MSFKKSVIFSTFFHFCLFAVTFLLSAVLFPSGSSKVLNEKVFFVKLTVDISKSSDGQKDDSNPQKKFLSAGFKTDNRQSTKPKKSESEKPKQDEIENSSILRVQNQPDLGEISATDKNHNDLNAEKESANNALLIEYEDSEDKLINVSSGQEMTLSIPHNSFFYGNKVISGGKGGGILPEIIKTIRNSLERAKTYPLLARKRGIEGIVYISFRISPQGEPYDLKVLKSSGYSILDKATMDIVKKAAPFPYVDSSIEVPVIFRLNK